MSSFANMKKGSGSFDKLSKALEQLNSSESGSDNSNNFWRPEVDKSGNGMATIRFLPAPEIDGDDSLPWVKIFSHGFQGPGGWLIDNCLTTKNQQCPVCEYNSSLWNSGVEANKDIVRKQKRKLNYVANVYIVSDPKNPDNEGQVKMFKFGKKIFDKITEAMNPAFEDETPINPFDLWAGANFKLKIRKVEGYQNYDKSEFESPSVLGNFSDDQLESIWKSEYSLQNLISDKEFKSYDDLKVRLDRVLGLSSTPKKTTVETIRSENPKKKFNEEEEESDWQNTSTSNSSSDEDSDMDYFSRLAEED